MKIQLAKVNCYPQYSVIIGDELKGEHELWDCDCASHNLDDVIRAAKEKYPDEKIIMFDDPDHYSQR